MVYVSVYRKKNRISYGKEQQVVKYTPKVPGSYIYIYLYIYICIFFGKEAAGLLHADLY